MRDAVGGVECFRVSPFINLLWRHSSFFLLFLLALLEVVALRLNQRHDVLVQIDIALIVHFKKLSINFQEMCPILATLFGFFLNCRRHFIGLVSEEVFGMLRLALQLLDLFLVSMMMMIVAVIHIRGLRYRVLNRLINLREVSGLKLNVELIHNVFEYVLEELRAEVFEALSDFDHEVREIRLESGLHHCTQIVYLLYNVRQMLDLLVAFAIQGLFNFFHHVSL